MKKPYLFLLLFLLIVNASITTIYTSPVLSLNTYVDRNTRLTSIQNLLPPTIDGDPSDWPRLLRLHPNITVDGKLNDWYTEYYPVSSDQITRSVSTNYSRNIYVWDLGNDNKYLYYKGEYIWFDSINDTRSLPTYVPWIDLTEVRVTGDDNYLYILVRVEDLDVLGNITQPSLLLSIPIDIDMNYTNGNITTIDQDTNVSKYAPWDYQIVVDLTNPNVESGEKIYGDGVRVSDNGSPLDILSPNYTDVSTSKSFFVADSGTDCVEIAIAWSDLNISDPWYTSNIRLYVLSFLGNGYGAPITSLSGSEVLDVLSSNDTDTEVSDGVIDYWVDIGFTTACEPTYYYHYMLDSHGFIQAYSDLSNDMRTDYIVNEAYDTDLLSTTLWIVPPDNSLYILIHVKGLVEPLGNISPAIAIVIDTTPFNLSDGASSWIPVPFLSDTDTEYGLPRSWNVGGRSVNWTHVIWFISKNVGTTQQYWVYVYNSTGIAYKSNITISGSEHFIEAWVPLNSIESDLGNKVFRFETLSFAYVLSTSIIPGVPRNALLDITGSNIYDSISPYTTYSASGIEIVNGKPYAIDGEVYDSDDNVTNDLATLNGDHWIDTFNTRKYNVIILNITLNHTSFDNDTYIEIGEPAWINATILYYNGSGWMPLANKYVEFYLVNTVDGEKIYLGGNYSTVNGTIVLDLNDIANKVSTSNYIVLASYSPQDLDKYVYISVSNTSDTAYSIYHQPFIKSLPEPYIIPLVIVIFIVILLLRKHYSHNHV